VHGKEKANLPAQSNLLIGLPEFAADQQLARRPDVELLAHRFEERLQDPQSPVRAVRKQAARAARTVAMPATIAPDLRAALARRGITELYSHQASSFDALESGKHVVVVTPTASGKTLCYNLPVLQRLSVEPTARALYLFPTKALSEDQLHEFQGIVDESGSALRAFTYDGDTPQDARRAIRERANVVLTNPDMLHTGVLPHHTRWAKLFENLRYIVLDELHYYRGVLGSHLANILRRLHRICGFYGTAPQFICCSATIANPKELAEALVDRPFELIDNNGAPSGEKYFVFCNPPVVNKQLGIRRSYLHESRSIAEEFIDRGQQTLVFCNNRLATEVLLTYLKARCETKPMGAAMVRGYRGGYLPRERREIERKLRDGEIRAVVSTNALELGIDIGSLDAVVLAGYPGTAASMLQRAGRAGRRSTTSIAVLVASSAPVDQYIVEHPDYFFGRPVESAHLNPDNLEIALNHLRCAAFELPIRDGERFGGIDTGELCRFLEETGFLHHSADAWHWTSDTYPADSVSLRAISSDNFVVVDITGDHRVIAEVSFSTALTALHEKAIYLHEGRQFQVERFDYDGRKAYVRHVDSDYFTDAIDYTQVKALEAFETADLNGAALVHGDVRVNIQVVGFKKIKFFTMENVGAGQLSMPQQEMHTTAVWLHFPGLFLDRLAGIHASERQSGLAALGNALRAVAALLLMCDIRDLGVAITEDSGNGLLAFEPDLYLYDAYPGGTGLSAPLFKAAPQLLSRTAELIAGCPCEDGCPSCVGPPGETGEGGKQTAAVFLQALTAG
jgi:DEAD/DEAH box helicase domain-containing protein